MKTKALALLLTGICLGCGSIRAAADRDSNPIVPLPPFHVDEFSSYLGFAWSAVLKEDKIASIRFSRVEQRSLASRAGLMEGDQLMAIDGQPVIGLTIEAMQRLFARQWKPGDTLHWEFTVARGVLFTREHKVVLQLKTKAVPKPDSDPGTEPESKRA